VSQNIGSGVVGSLNCRWVGLYRRIKASGSVNDLPKGGVQLKFSMNGVI